MAIITSTSILISLPHPEGTAHAKFLSALSGCKVAAPGRLVSSPTLCLLLLPLLLLLHQRPPHSNGNGPALESGAGPHQQKQKKKKRRWPPPHRALEGPHHHHQRRRWLLPPHNNNNNNSLRQSRSSTNTISPQPPKTLRLLLTSRAIRTAPPQGSPFRTAPQSSTRQGWMPRCALGIAPQGSALRCSL